MNTSMEDFKPPITQHDFVHNTETNSFKMSPLPWTTDESTKTGEIFRNSKGQYSFMCFHCGLTFEDFGEIIGHCDSHIENDVKYDINIQPPEFVFCAEIESDLAHRLSPPMPETTSIEPTLATDDATHLTKKSKKSHAPVQESRREKTLMPEFPQNCPICEVWCDDFRGHMKTAHRFPSRVYQCFICKEFFKLLSTLKKHISCSKHTKGKCYHCEMEPAINNPSDARRHKCLFCKEWFANHIEFKIHFKDAHDKDADYFFHKRSNCNIFTCYVCEREFPLRYYLSAHMKTHHEKFLRHQCPTCGRRMRTFGQLTQHLKTHEGKVYECNECDKKFAYYARLRMHLESHRKELNFKCDLCSKAFKKRGYLKRHMAVHTNDKKYSCKFCSASFNFTSGRRAHEKSQHTAL